MRRLAVLAVGAVVLILVFRRHPPTRHPVDSLLLAQALFAPEERAWLARWSSSPSRREVPTPDGSLDLYRPGGEVESSRGCVLLAHGMTDLGRRDPRLRRFARNLARLGFSVAVPDLRGMKRFRPDRRDVSSIAEAFSWLSAEHHPPGGRCGLLAFSFAAGPALMAAARQEVARGVGYFVAFGAYYELRAVLRHLTTGGGGEAPAYPGGPPVRYGKWLFLRYNAALLGLGGHETEVEEIVRRKLASEDADVAALRAALPESARRVLLLMENRDPEKFAMMYAQQDRALRARLESWSLENVIPRTRMPVFLLHGRDDPFVPPRESRRLARRARRRPPEAGGVRTLVLDFFSHVEPRAGLRWPGLGGGWEAVRFLGFVSEVLTEMERE